MLISLNWLRDFVDLPDGLDPRELALRFTTTTAEVDSVHHVEPNFDGLVTGKIESLRAQAGDSKLKSVVIDVGDKKYNSLTTAPDVKVGDLVAFAPPGASVGDKKIGATDSSGRPAEGMIVAWGALGFPNIGAHALVLPPSAKPGDAIDRALFDDWIIEIDNKSITHRPDCWGHYGVARELAAMLDRSLKPYPITDSAELKNSLPPIPIEIDDPAKCPRYTALAMKGLSAQPAPLAIQVRLAMCGMRPIDLIVDLTNYIMLELGQPMHAFDAAKMSTIQVATAQPNEKFTTLDGITRTMPAGTLMIQSNRKSIGIAGIMGGAATEVSSSTQTVLLESANFQAASIRKAATAMGHRTEASARFEKSLDPAHTVLGIARFHKLARAELPALDLAGTLSDCYPVPLAVKPIELNCAYAARIIGKPIASDEMKRILQKLEFRCESAGENLLVTPPSFRATKDIQIEADLVEEIARFIGYNNIDPALPRVAARYFDPMPQLSIEDRTLTQLCQAGEFTEVHDYIWHDDDWCKTLAFDPGECITLQNPAADNCSRLRKTLSPGLLRMADQNRHHFDRFQLAEIGTVFFPGQKSVEESQERRLGLLAAQAGKKADSVVWNRIRVALDGWGLEVLNEPPRFKTSRPLYPWEDADRLAEIVIAGRSIGRMTILPLTAKQKIDERLAAWSIAVAELSLSALTDLIERHNKLPTVPRFPQVHLDFSALADSSKLYESIAAQLQTFSHPALRRLSFIESYHGGSIPAGKRSLLLRAEIGLPDRTLTDDDIQGFQSRFKQFLTSGGLDLRA